MLNRTQLLNRVLSVLLACVICAVLLGAANVGSAGLNDQIRRFSRAYEFDYLEWELGAFLQKAVQAATKAEKLLNHDQQTRVVNSYFLAVREQNQLETDLKNVLASPSAPDEVKAIELKQALDLKTSELQKLSRLAEPIIQNQTELSLTSLGFGFGGQVLPPVLYSVSEMPMNLIVSPRTEISNLFEINLEPGLDVLEREKIENGLFSDFSLAALVEPIGGLGAYPTMVMQSSDIAWLLDTVSHEWTHNWLTFHSLGMRYFTSDQLKTINETTASISGKEISRQTLKTWYPQYLPAEERNQTAIPKKPGVPEEESFSFRREMHTTRVRVDQLLKEGKVEDAEAYMESRRAFLWENGYRLRK
ncbi:MAG TPA: hypothetical protein VLR89_08045, partial [Anaerolineaceae bacterium]|nr:hypothetical protein [Anaerolineaceae bacterium]